MRKCVFHLFLFFLIYLCACAHSPVSMSDRKPLNLSIDREITRLMKITCAESEEDVSEVTEQLYREFLKKRGKKPSIYRKNGKKK